MIRIKTKKEIEILRQGGHKLAAILDELVGMVRPGVSTEDLENKAVELITNCGGRPAFKDLPLPNGEVFPTALCTSINEQVVHVPAIPSQTLKFGDIIGIDIGMEFPVKKDLQKSRSINEFSKLGGYYTDMAVTVAVGEVGGEVERLLKVTKNALMLGIKQVRAGASLNAIGKAIQEHAESHGYGVVRELVGHGVGHEYHEEPNVPNYDTKNEQTINTELKPGMVLAIEPMVNMGGWRIETGSDGMSIVTADGSLSAQFEHSVVVTKDGVEILTSL